MCHLDLTIDLAIVTFNLGSAKVCPPAIIDTHFSYDKDIRIAVSDYCLYFYLIVLFL